MPRVPADGVWNALRPGLLTSGKGARTFARRARAVSVTAYPQQLLLR